MATIPKVIQKFAESEKDEFSSIAQANWRKMASLLEYLNRSFPVGMLMFFTETQEQMPATPDPKYWHYMDGSAVSNVNSPMNGQTPPDLRNKFIRHPETGQPALAFGGQNTVSLGHAHSGFTGFSFDMGPNYAESGTDVPYPPTGYHRHAISTSMGITSTIPQFRFLQVYMRIA